MEEKVSTARVALKYGVLFSIAIMVYTTILNVAGLAQNQWLSSLSFVILIIAIVVAMKNFKEQNHGFMSYGEGLGLGSLISAIMGLLGAAFGMFYMQFIDNTIVSKALDKTRAGMEAKGMDDTQIDQAMEVTQKFMSPGFMFIIAVVGYLIIGFILSLIISLILRKEKPVFE